MSLLIDALRKAEQDREDAQARLAETAELSLEPLATAPEAPATPPLSEARAREAASNLFSVKHDPAPHSPLVWFAIAGIAAGLLIAAWVWWQMQPVGLGVLVKRGGVIPARGARLGGAALFLEKHTQCRCSAAEGGSDSGRQTVSRGRADDQYPFGTIFDRPPAFDILDLSFDIGVTTRRVSRDTEKSAYAWFDDHWQAVPGL